MDGFDRFLQLRQTISVEVQRLQRLRKKLGKLRSTRSSSYCAMRIVHGRVKGDTRFSFIIIEQWKQGYALFVSIVSTCYIKSQLIETGTVGLESFKPLKYDDVTLSDLCLTRGKRNQQSRIRFQFGRWI